MRRAIVTLAVVCVVLIAGCGGGTDGTTTEGTTVEGTTTSPGDGGTTTSPGDGETTTSPGDGETTTSPGGETTTSPGGETTTSPGGETTTSPGGDVENPPGVSDKGVENATMLYQAHQQALNDSDGWQEEVSLQDSGPGSDGGTVTVAFDRETMSLYINNKTGDSVTTWYWETTTNTIAIRQKNATATKYSYNRNPSGFLGFVVALVYSAYHSTPQRVLQIGQFERAGTVTQDGQKLIKLEATGLKDGAKESGLFDKGETPKGMSGTVLVTPEGKIESMDVEISYEEDGSTYTKSIQYAVTADDPEINEPDWFSQVPQLKGSYQESGKLYAVQNTAGATIPKGTKLQVQRGRVLGNVTLSESVEPGETIYIWATGSLSDAELHVSVGSKPSLPSDAVKLSKGGTSTYIKGQFGDVQFQVGNQSTSSGSSLVTLGGDSVSTKLSTPVATSPPLAIERAEN